MTTLSKVICYNDMQRITSEFARLKGRCYLENAGAALYPQSLLQRVNEDLLNNVYMNPHSDKYTKDCIEQIRYLILRHFNTDPQEYTVIFTSGTTQALKLTVESFQFVNKKQEDLSCGSFVYLRDNHTSVLGLREIAADKNAEIVHISHEDFLKYIDPELSYHTINRKENEGNTLVTYPAQSNFNGYKYPLHAIQSIKDGSLNSYIKKHLCKMNSNWFVLLDAASFVATSKLDLSKYKPDFITFSFYKIFGYPTGLGALLVKNTSAHVLSQKRYFGGGTVDVVLSGEDFNVRRQNLCERFEDGTQAFLAILALKHCFDTMQDLIPKAISDHFMDTISYHTFSLAQDLHKELRKLEHANGVKAAVLYHDSDFTDINKQGSIVTFGLMRDDKSFIGYAEFQHMADLFQINVRTGCFCNSGSCQRHLKATNKEMKDMYKAGHKCGDDLDLINGKPTGAVRASFSYYNTYEDVDQLMSMICKCFVPSKYKKPKRKMSTYHYVNGDSFNTKTELSKEIKLHPNSLPNTPVEIKTLIQQSPIDVKTPTSNGIMLSEIAIFPIKSCGKFKVTSGWNIGPKGLEFDREWMIVKDNGVCLTQKQNTFMCLIRPFIDLNNRLLVLNYEDRTPISVPIDMNPREVEKETTMCQSRVCADPINGIDCGDDVADWISEALGISYLRLIRQSANDKRSQKRKNEGDNPLLSFSNKSQFLLINKASIRWLNSKISDPDFSQDIDDLTDRFRGNLIIDMKQELVETEWQRINIGKHEFEVNGSCTRCTMVCINQQTGHKTVEPLRTISELFAGKLRFGIYLTYIGTTDGSKDSLLRNYSEVEPVLNEDDISR
ncbi:hypothetical protein O0L34_g4509 [Tuta absoluta]|nr:hypothetical protein O0L34_g4509 [Tuta absoluta]